MWGVRSVAPSTAHLARAAQTGREVPRPEAHRQAGGTSQETGCELRPAKGPVRGPGGQLDQARTSEGLAEGVVTGRRSRDSYGRLRPQPAAPQPRRPAATGRRRPTAPTGSRGGGASRRWPTPARPGVSGVGDQAVAAATRQAPGGQRAGRRQKSSTAAVRAGGRRGGEPRRHCTGRFPLPQRRAAKWKEWRRLPYSGQQGRQGA